MKIRIFFILILFSSFNLIGQSYKFVYEVSMVKYECFPNHTTGGFGVLFVTDSMSRYFDHSLLDIDPKTNRRNTKANLFDYLIFKKDDSLQFRQGINNVAFYYNEPIPQIGWEILEETKTILGYTSQKAIGEFSGRKYTAWFSNEIPINDGPDKFGGLPGLILKLEDAEKKFSFNLISIEQQVKPVSFRLYNNGKKVSKKEFKAREEEFYLNYKQYYSDLLAGLKATNSPEGFKRIEKIFEGVTEEYLCRNIID